MSSIFITTIEGTGVYAIPSSDATLATATSSLTSLIDDLGGTLTYKRILAWVGDAGGPGGAEGTRTLNCLIEQFAYDSEECPDATETAALTAALDAALVGDHGGGDTITDVGPQQVHINLNEEYYFWDRDSGSEFVYLEEPTDDIAVGGTTPNGKWFQDGDIVLNENVMHDTELLRVVGNEYLAGGLLMTEVGVVPLSPGAAEGTFWVRTATPNVPGFTDDAGVDHTIAYESSLYSLPSIEQTIFVDKASGGAYVADGTIQKPYNTITAAIAAAVTAGASAASRFGIIIYPGIYDETITLSTAGIFLIGSGPEVTIVEQSSGASTVLTTTVSTIGCAGLTFRTTGTATGNLFTNSSAAATGDVYWQNCYFQSVSGAGYLDFAQDINLRASFCKFIHADDSSRIVDLDTASGCEVEFLSCRFEGQVYSADDKQSFNNCYITSSATSNGTVFVASDVQFFGCQIFNTGAGAACNAIVLGASGGGKALGCRIVGGDNASYDITGASAYDFEVVGCSLNHGLSSNVVQEGSIFYSSGSDGDLDFYVTVIDAKTQATAGSIIYMLGDETSSSDLNAGTSDGIVIDGQGHSYTGSGAAIFTSEAADITFRNIYLTGQIVFNTGDCVVRFEKVDLEGRIFWDVGTADSHLYVHDSRLEGTSTYPRPLTFDSSAVNNGSMIFDHSYLKGYTGNGAVYFTSNVD
jgi:hypothetical protein